MYAVVLGSKFVKSTEVDLGSSLEKRDIYINSTTCGKQFWSNEPLRCGIAVQLTERKKGSKYTKADGSEGEVTKDGWNFDMVIGNADSIKTAKETKSVLKELQDL